MNPCKTEIAEILETWFAEQKPVLVDHLHQYLTQKLQTTFGLPQGQDLIDEHISQLITNPQKRQRRVRISGHAHVEPTSTTPEPTSMLIVPDKSES